MAEVTRSQVFVAVNCPCGRSLRAKIEQVGTEIRCWDCHKMVLIPLPRESKRVTRELSAGALAVLKRPGLNSVVIGALVATAILAIPGIGTWCSVIAFALGAAAYGEFLRRAGRFPTDKPEPIWRMFLRPGMIANLVLSLIFAAGTVVPLWIWNAAEHQSPHWSGLGLLAMAANWLILPLLMLGVSGQEHQGTWQSFRAIPKGFLKHPLATLLALALIPSTLILAEFVLDLLFIATGSFSFFALDLMPMPQTPSKPEIFDGVPFYDTIDFRSHDLSKFLSGYFDNLGHGYSFVGAIPASMANMTQADLNVEAAGLVPVSYFIFRFMIVMMIVTGLIAAFAIQARWLRSIVTLDDLRPLLAASQPLAVNDPALLP